MKPNRKGFTLVEIIVVAACIAILAAILTPMIINAIEDSKKSSAMADCKAIQTAMLMFKKDTGSYPYKGADFNCTTLNLAYSFSGTMPTFAINGWTTDDPKIEMTFLRDATGLVDCKYNNWKGPYLAQLSADPWGNKYVVNMNALDPNHPAYTNAVWVLSAGPNGVINTNTTNLNLDAAQDDDIGVRIK